MITDIDENINKNDSSTEPPIPINELDQTKVHQSDANIFELTDKEQFHQFQQDMIHLEEEMQRELRIKTRKIAKHEIYLKETKNSYKELVEEIQNILKPNSVRKMIKEELVQKLKREIKD